MNDLTFTPGAVPAVTRETKPNPLIPVVENLAKNRDQSLSTTLADKERRAKVIRQAQDAGRVVGVTVRTKVDGDVLTLWAVDRRTYKARDTNGDTTTVAVAEAPAETPAEAPAKK